MELREENLMLPGPGSVEVRRTIQSNAAPLGARLTFGRFGGQGGSDMAISLVFFGQKEGDWGGLEHGC